MTKHVRAPLASAAFRSDVSDLCTACEACTGGHTSKTRAGE